jgi:menaquinone-dependent protoporphyrinogen oxidase
MREVATMSRILIAYGTSEGQTARIAERIAAVVREHGHEAVPVNVKRSTPDPAEYDAVIVGASVHRGRHQTEVGEYVRETRNALERVPTAFFSVSLAIAEPTEAARKEAEGYAEEFFRLTRWHPGKLALFAGALLYTRYGFLTRWIMKRIARAKGSPDLDTSRDYEYTDWGGVTRFAEEFLAVAAPRAIAEGSVLAGR